MNASQLQRIVEIYRRTEYQRNSSPDKQLQKKRESGGHLKSKDIVPTKLVRPIDEQVPIRENVQQVLMNFRRAYQANRPMRFRDWIQMVAKMLNDMD